MLTVCFQIQDIRAVGKKKIMQLFVYKFIYLMRKCISISDDLIKN